MSTIGRRLGSAAAAVALAGGIGLATATPAQAYDLVEYYSASDVRQVSDAIDKGLSVCGLIPGVNVACLLSGWSEMNEQFRDAARDNCGLRIYVTATGSGMSYDKAEYDYARVC